MKVLREFKYYMNGTKSEEKVSSVHPNNEVDTETFFYDRKGQMVKKTYENSNDPNAKYEEKYEKFNDEGMPTIVKYKGFNQAGGKVEYTKLIEYDEEGVEKTITFLDKKGNEMKKIDMLEEEE